MNPFEATGPLPSGRTVLEASAGTGKTWTIAALVTRYVAEAGVPIDEMLVVTFTRAATFELRERCRARLVEAARHLRAPRATDDPILTALADCDQAERDLRHRRLDDALRRFDRATITTLHGLAHRFLQEMGLLARTTPPREVVADQAELVDEVVNDVFVGMFADGSETLAASTATAIARAVAGVPDAAIVPEVGEAEGAADVRARFAFEVRRRLEERAKSGRVTSYDGLLLAARDALRDSESGRMAAARLRDRYQVALIDEFQDTDGIQWQTVDAVFADPEATMVLIGDPKQSIYAFRGADIGAYLEAADGAPSNFTLQTNWRSDAPLLAAFDVVFEGVTFGDHRIPYRTVSAAPGRDRSRLQGVEAPLLIRCVGRDAPVKTVNKGTLSVPSARSFIARDTAAYVVELLTRPAQIEEGDDGARPVRPGDIAVLCRTNFEVDAVRRELAARGVPAVVARTGNVLLSEAANDWLFLLEALESPASSSRVRAAALTCFLGWSAERLASATDEDLLPLHDRVGSWATTLRDHGVAALWKAIESDEGVTARALSLPGGERLITDLGHVTEMIHAAHRSGAFSLHEWLLSAILHAQEDGDEERARRLETDADAVQVLTAHASKGLEFPIVLCPFFWSQPRDWDDVPVFHPEGSDRRLVAVGGSDGWDGHDRAKELVARQSDGENMRLLYVALTRARHHVVCWWAATADAAKTPLTRFLFGRVNDSIRETATVVSDARMLGYLDARIDRAAGAIARQVLTAEPIVQTYRPLAPTAPSIEVAHFDRPIDRAWTRTSFSSLTHDAPHVAVVEAETLVKLDEPVDDESVDDEPATVDALPMADLPGGVAFGNLVHSVFEDVDLSAPDRAERIRTECERHVLATGSDIDPDVLTDALLKVADTPLFATDDAPTLTAIPRSDQRAEMTFELSVSPSGPTVTLAGIADLLESSLDPADPMRAYAGRVRSLSRTTFHGFLTGAIDGVVRLGSTFWVMDYKTNRLGDRTRPLAIDDHAPDRLDRAMLEGDYVMQSLLYQVALHRFLSVRVTDYRPEEHLGGSLYLFVRGMTGPDTPTRDGHRFGVHRWDAPHGLITAVSDLFDRGVA